MSCQEYICFWIVDSKVYHVKFAEHECFKLNNEKLFCGSSTDNQYRITVCKRSLNISIENLTNKGLEWIQLFVMDELFKIKGVNLITEVLIHVDDDFWEFKGDLNEFLLLEKRS